MAEWISFFKIAIAPIEMLCVHSIKIIAKSPWTESV